MLNAVLWQSGMCSTFCVYKTEDDGLVACILSYTIDVHGAVRFCTLAIVALPSTRAHHTRIGNGIRISLVSIDACACMYMDGLAICSVHICTLVRKFIIPFKYINRPMLMIACFCHHRCFWLNPVHLAAPHPARIHSACVRTVFFPAPLCVQHGPYCFRFPTFHRFTSFCRPACVCVVCVRVYMPIAFYCSASASALHSLASMKI